MDRRTSLWFYILQEIYKKRLGPTLNSNADESVGEMPMPNTVNKSHTYRIFKNIINGNVLGLSKRIEHFISQSSTQRLIGFS